MSMREWRASRSSIWSKKPIPVATVDTPDPSRLTLTSMSVSLVLRLIVAVRIKSAPRDSGSWRFNVLKTRPFNRLMTPSLLRDGGPAKVLRPMVSGIRQDQGICKPQERCLDQPPQEGQDFFNERIAPAVRRRIAP